MLSAQTKFTPRGPGFPLSVYHTDTNTNTSTDNVGVYWTYEVGGKSYVVRRYIGSDLVAGNLITNNVHVISPSCDHIQDGNNEELVVDAACRVTWVPYDSTAGQPMLTGALIRGFLLATNIPLYVGKLAGGIVGYYNPLTDLDVGHCCSRSDAVFEVMVVQPPSFNPWLHSDTWTPDFF